MDPLSVVKTLWRHKFILIPVLLVTVVAAAYLFAFGPRSYQATATFALVNPMVPSEREILEDPALGDLNSNNPYLRSSDNTLIAQVLTTRLSSQEVAKSLLMQGLNTEYTVERAGSFGTGLLVQTTATGSSPEQAMDTVKVLGEYLVQELEAMQEVNGADQRYLFTALAVTSGDQAVEQFSSRLRSVIMVGAGGVVLLFAAVSGARALDRRREEEEGSLNTGNGAGSGGPQLAERDRPEGGPDDASEPLKLRQLRRERKKDLRRRRPRIKARV
ncbi:chain-length determining protein [Specibacter sp. NPDC057265]|uniref:chain-length determining protein n=1 Tax=Specibacter sp. NPDC057265 TaxID=3346075 RepID=UPI003634D36F